jgi:hypothetical protein
VANKLAVQFEAVLYLYRSVELDSLQCQCHCSREHSFHCRIESIIYPAIRKTPCTIHVAKSRVAAFHLSKSELEVKSSSSQVEAERETPATSLDHEKPRLQLQYNTTTLRKDKKNGKLGRSNTSRTTNNNSRECPPQLPTAPPPPPPQQQTMPATRPVSSARLLALR